MILLKDGSTYSGSFTINHADVMVRCNGHCIVNGGFIMNGENTWVWGIEFTAGALHQAGIDMFCKNCVAVNNVVHAINSAPGIGAWNTGPGQIIYGNIVFSQTAVDNNPHNIYSQNSFTANGYKYFIANYVGEVPSTGNTYGFHAYAQGNHISGYWLERNIIDKSTMLVGSKSTLLPDHDQVFKDNYFYSAEMRPCFARPTWFTATGNYFGRSRVRTECQWGDPESVFPEIAGPTIFKNNSLINPNGQHILMFAYSYKDPCSVKDPGCPRIQGVNIRSDNDFDNNRFVPNFTADLWVGGIHQGVTDLPTWQQRTEAAGKKFDANSTVNVSESNKSFFI
ncbi:hypothetical protein L0244_08540, partial [bacterium]|nr:hypothetical protein [bacterium]